MRHNEQGTLYVKLHLEDYRQTVKNLSPQGLLGQFLLKLTELRHWITIVTKMLNVTLKLYIRGYNFAQELQPIFLRNKCILFVCDHL